MCKRINVYLCRWAQHLYFQISPKHQIVFYGVRKVPSLGWWRRRQDRKRKCHPELITRHVRHSGATCGVTCKQIDRGRAAPRGNGAQPGTRSWWVLDAKNNNTSNISTEHNAVSEQYNAEWVGQSRHSFIRNRTSNTEIGRAKTGWGAAETGFASPISVLQVLF